MPDDNNEVVDETPGTETEPEETDNDNDETPGEGGDDTPGGDTPTGDDDDSGDDDAGDDDSGDENSEEETSAPALQRVIRQTVAADSEYHAFDFECVTIEAAFVKNFTAGNIFVSLGGEPENDTKAIKIASNTAQTVQIGNHATWDLTYVKAASAGDVEVQLLAW